MCIRDSNKGDQKVLFNTVNKLLHRNSSKVLPSSTSDLNLAEKFADFFINKVATIHDELNKFPSDLNYCTSSVDNSSAFLLRHLYRDSNL